MPQLELGYIPIQGDVREGMNVAFLIDRRITKKRKEKIVLLGRIISVLNGRVVIEELTAPGSRHNRAVGELYEVHKDTVLQEWA